ncbi:MAG TPA: enolase C-terminal domain-like protein, partial [Chthonomonadales bacterium]|nr:enolase C-terminal domain-like protein [Chthonomonadales bacterium]
EPVPPDNLDALKKASEQIANPVATGERLQTRFGFRKLLEQQACDVIQPDVTHVGGISELRKVAAMADASYVMVAPHDAAAPITTMASLHAVTGITNFKIQECFDDFCEPHVLEAITGRPVVKDGYFELPQEPGMGTDIREEVIAAHPYVEGSFNLWDPEWHKRKFKLDDK